MDPIMGTIHSNSKPAEIAAYSIEIRISETSFPGMELHESKSYNIPITSKKDSLHCLAEQHKEHTHPMTQMRM
jgi:hypothetical protein